MEEFDMEDGSLSKGFMENSDDFAPLREFIAGQKKILQSLGFSEESSDKMAAKLWDFYLESMILELRKQGN